VKMSTSPDSADYGRFDELAEEFAKRYRRGERPSLQEFIDRLPEMADEIREMFPALIEVEQVEGDARDDILLPPQPAVPCLRQLGDYRIIREIGRGGMGVVYEAEQVSLRRHVALKVLPNQALKDPQHKRRFEREARAAAKLHHTNIVPVFGVGEHDGLPYYVMQYIQGLGLDAVIDELNHIQPGGSGTKSAAEIRLSRRGAPAAQMAQSLLTGAFPYAKADVDLEGSVAATTVSEPAQEPDDPGDPNNEDATLATNPAAPTASHSSHPSDSFSLSASSLSLPRSGSAVSGRKSAAKKQTYWQSVANIGRQVGDALEYAHKQGVLHRDIKPSNLLLDMRGTVWVTDFGLAKVSGADGDNLTHTGDILGTLRYMPPEAFEGKSDARSDVYSLGMTLYELLAMRPAFDERDRNKLIKQVTLGEPTPLYRVRREIPRDLVTIVQKSIEREPSGRYAKAEELAADLQRFIDDEPILARRQTPRERYVRWARHNPAIAVLGAVLTAVLVLVTIASLIVAGRMAQSAADERWARQQAVESQRREADARAHAEQSALEANRQSEAAQHARLDALDNTYSATRNEVTAMRLARQSGWRTAALDRIRNLVRLGSRNLDRVDLRSEALACLAEMDIRLQSKFTVPSDPQMGAWHLRYSPDGQILAVNDNKKNRVYLKNLVTKQELPSIPTSDGLAPFVFHPSGTLAVSPTAGRVAFRPLRSGQPSFPEITGDGYVLNLAFNRSGDRLAVAWGEINVANGGQPTKPHRVTVHESATGAKLWAIDLPANTPVSYKFPLALSADGHTVATVGPGWEIGLYSVGTNDPPIVLGKLDGRICALKFHPDGRSLVGGGIAIGAVWNLRSRSELFRVHVPESGMWDIDFSPDGRLIAGVCDQRTVSLWDARSGRELATIPSECGSYCLSLAFSPEGERFAVAGSYVAVFQIEGRKECRQVKAAYTGNFGLAFDKAHEALLSCGGDVVRSWDLNDPAPSVLRTTDKRGCYPAVVRLAPDGRDLALGFVKYLNATAEGDFSVTVWRLEKPMGERFLKGPKSDVIDVTFDPTGKNLAAASVDGGLYLWNFETGELRYRVNIGRVTARGNFGSAVRFLDATQLLVATAQRVILVSAKDGAVRHEVNLPTPVVAFVITPDRRECFISTSGGTVYRARLPDLVIDHSRRFLDHAVDWMLTISPDGGILAMGTTTEVGARGMLIERRTLEPIARLPDLDKSLYCIEFDHDGRHLAMGGRSIVLWDFALIRAQLAGLGLDFGEFKTNQAASVEAASCVTQTTFRR
jgi:eukaryotic-like serine/threonine-protein kinase